MDGFWHLNLIRFLDFLFAWMFFASLYRRFRQYRTIGRLAFAGPGRWPRLLQLIRQHRTIFITWKTLAPALVMLVLWGVQLTASRLVWPTASAPLTGLEVRHLAEHWPALLYIVPVGAAMLAFEAWGLTVVSEIDRAEIEKYFDQAEFWLRSPAAVVVKVATFGYVNPRKMVNEEVRKALVAAGDMINYNLWWISTQTALRFAFGLALWLTWAFFR
ncbi:MAG: hypothetical protein L0Y71_20825 [Gemmataceae bacterium]|nr:hypothetical protein [Gemmataceae bacterium]